MMVDDYVEFLVVGFLLVAILVNALALQGAVRGRFRRSSTGRRQNLSVISYQQCLISLLLSNVFICAVNAVLLVLSNAFKATHAQGVGSEAIVGIIQRLALVGFLANLLNYCIISCSHFAQVVCPHASSSCNIFGNKIAADLAIALIWAFSVVIGFLDIPVLAAIQSVDGVELASNLAKVVSPIIPDVVVKNETMLLLKTAGAKKTKNRTFAIVTNRKAVTLKRQTVIATTTSPFAIRLQKEENSTNFDEDNNSYLNELAETFKGSLAYKTWLEIVTMFLALVVMLLLVALCVVVVDRTNKTLSKVRLRRSMITAILLLCCFIVCWAPLVFYDMLVYLPRALRPEEDPLLAAQQSGDWSVAGSEIVSDQVDYYLYPICLAVFMMSPILPPIIVIFRNRLVQRFLVDRYNCILPSCLAAQFAMSSRFVSSSVRSFQPASSEKPLLTLGGQSSAPTAQNNAPPACDDLNFPNK